MKLFESIKIRDLIIENPIILAPLCGITDSPYRRLCTEMGAGITFVEMISATAVIYGNEKTMRMMATHKDEKNVGIQITGRYYEEVARAVEIIEQKKDFPLYDINMGCPAKKVVKNGSGSAILKEPQNVYDYVKAVREVIDKPLSVKLRAGWDRKSINIDETSKAAEEGGADLITVHGRTRADDYSIPNNLEWIKIAKDKVSIPVIGNGDIFSINDLIKMKKETGIDGVMLARGILGNPYLFKSLKINNNEDYKPDIMEWKNTIMKHIDYFEDFYENIPANVVTMRKHLLWYCKGWRNIKKLKAQINNVSDIKEARRIINEFADNYKSESKAIVY